MLIKSMEQILMWGSWLIIPVIVEIFRNLNILVRASAKILRKKDYNLDFHPYVTILIPVYNSAKTLKACLQSISNQSYPTDNLEIFLINNGPRDESYNIFQEFQSDNSRLKIWWMDSDAGKSKALNKGIFASKGKYILNIDSDGWLDKDAIRNVVCRFESDREISCMTGVIMIDPNLIEETKNKGLKLLQRCEFVEYVESFLIGRNCQSQHDSLYTLAGAFSCFRKEAILKTQLYNSDTLGEDTHMTFQIKKFVGGKVLLCNDAYLFVDPIESVDKLYMQRQRWQKSELEVARLFSEFYEGGIFGILKNFTLRLIILDHSIAFLNLLWTFSIIYFTFVGYPLKYFILSHIMLFMIYTTNSLISGAVASQFLKNQKLAGDYVKKHRYVAFLMTGYRLINYLIRVAGIVNSVKTEPKWYTKTLSQEIEEVIDMFKPNVFKKQISEELPTAADVREEVPSGYELDSHQLMKKEEELLCNNI